MVIDDVAWCGLYTCVFDDDHDNENDEDDQDDNDRSGNKTGEDDD